MELLSHPELRDKPVAVCGDPTQRHGIILAKNEHAKRCGVKTAETIYQAKKKCPELILLPPHHERYAHFSRLVNEIYAQYTDLVEPFGIDESWLDITHTLHLFGGDAKALADNIRERVKAELGLTLSVGVSFNKVFAKLGSDYKKPDATTLISEDNWRDMVRPLPVGDLLFETIDAISARDASPAITAPVSGAVTLMQAVSGAQVYRGMLLCEIADLSVLELSAEVDELDLSAIRVGDVLTYTLDAYGEKAFTGTITEIRPIGAARQNATYFDVRITAPKNVSILPGMNATVQLP